MSAGFGFLGLDPLQSLQRRVEDQPQQQQAPTPAAAAPSAAPAAAPAGDGGGMMGFLGNLFSGKGFGGSQPGDDQVDPNTGVSVGQMRQMNLQGMQKMGLVLLSASGRMSNDQRAAIMSRLPEAMDNSAQLNGFAKARLQMAEMRLKERELAAKERQSAGFTQLAAQMAGGGAPASSGPAAPTQQQTQAVAQAAAAGDTMGAASAATGGAVPAQAAAPAQAGAPAQGGQPAFSPQEAQALALIGPEGGLPMIMKRLGETRDQEVPGEPYVDPQTGRKMVDVFKHGQKVRSSDLGPILSRVSEEGGRIVTRTGDAVTGISAAPQAPEDPQDVAERTANFGVITKRADKLNEARAGAITAATGYDRVAAAQKAVLADKTFTGLQGTDAAQKGANLLASLGILSDAGRKALVETNGIEAIFAQSGGEFAKQYYGPQISNSDVENARKAIGGIQSGQPEVVAAALGRIKDSYRRTVEQFDKDADSHNNRLGAIRGAEAKANFSVEKIGRKFEDDAAPQQQQAPAAVPDQAAAYLKSNPNLRAQFDAKYGAGASARILGR
jgi:hypothetical protein